MIKTMLGSVREFKKPTILTLLLIIGEVFIEVLIPFYTAELVNRIKAGVEMQSVVRLGLILVGTCAGISLRESSTFPLRTSTGFRLRRLSHG